ncbi:DUF3122 domain-containing protein [Almyronema epifaneia]|uniref:DUF3122 domain-containing protein n=1 Tax=Almyronema epifaneia S1 TaxID=2991925 RepID=A0ABW6IDQ4_9CYAN
MTYHTRKVVSLLAATALVGLFFLCAVLQTPPALAAIRQLEEAPGQIVYQARQTVPDQQGDRWQLIAFNRVRPNGQTSFYLRLVGFPGKAEIDRSRSLLLTSSLGQRLTAQEASSQIFTDAAAAAPNIGQYDLKPIVSQLAAAVPLQLTLPTLNQDDVLLTLTPAYIQEWKTVAAYEPLFLPPE